MQYYIDDQHGTNLCGRLSEESVYSVALGHANTLGAPVYYYDPASEIEATEVCPHTARPAPSEKRPLAR